jgi:formylglycine-generating enzyme required for sulfatase activity
MAHIFISYRRDDNAIAANAIYTRLVQTFGEQDIFFDVHGMPLGVDWEAHLREQVQRCQVMLVVIGRDWLTIRDPETGERRLDQAIDFVRYEIETALERNIAVIPLFLDGVRALPAADLPESIRPLARRQGQSIRRAPDFEADVGRLTTQLERMVRPVVTPAAPVGNPIVYPAIVREVTPPPPPAEPTAGTRMVDDYGIPMVYVPAGKFLMGSTPGQVEEAFQQAKKENKDAKKEWYERELPQHEQTIRAGFWLDLTPVTNESYAHFVKDGGYQNTDYWTEAGWNWVQSGGKTGPNDYQNLTAPQQPRVGVTWFEAWAYCQWRGGRLPTEAEWEWAARGPENRLYPWGNTFDASRVIYAKNAGGKSSAVGEGVRKAGASWVGALDMSGNVWEWCSSLYQPYLFDANNGREDSLDGTNVRVLRGGSFLNTSYNLRAVNRDWINPATEDHSFGFRCARSR